MKRIALLLAVVTFAASSLTLCAQQPRSPGKRPGDQRMGNALRVGETAPDFKLKTKDGSREVQLASFKGKRPVVLVFGSYT